MVVLTKNKSDGQVNIDDFLYNAIYFCICVENNELYMRTHHGRNEIKTTNHNNKEIHSQKEIFA